MKNLFKITPLLLLTACNHPVDTQASGLWGEELLPLTSVRPRVEVYEVEFLPVLPNTPDTLVVGRFHVPDGAELQYDNEAMVQTIKQRAAAMGGNTIVYPHTGIKVVTVAYVPIEPSLHGGDEY